MTCSIKMPNWTRMVFLFLAVTLCVHGAVNSDAAASPASPAASVGAEKIVASAPTRMEVEGRRLSGRLTVAPEILSADMYADLVYTITGEPRFGRVGLAGEGDEADFFVNQTSRLGYFVYEAREDYTGEDEFSYTVRNTTSGLVFENRVVIQVRPPPPVVLDKFVVQGSRERTLTAAPVALSTRPNTPVVKKIPNHQDFMREADRVGIANAKVVYALDDKARPQHGTAKLDAHTGELAYAPNPGFIGEDRFNYYTTDENNPALGVENVITVTVEPIRTPKQKIADRSKSRQVDLVFVINNSRSMAPHQQRIAENLRRFRRLFDERQLDYRIGVLTTDFVNEGERYAKTVGSVQLDAAGRPVLDRKQKPKRTTKEVASNGQLVTLPGMPQPWVTPQTPDGVFAELVQVGTNGDSNRTAFTAVYNFVADAQAGRHTLLRPEATTIVVYFMDEEETRMATWREQPGGARRAEWVEDGKLPELIQAYNARHPDQRQTLDSYINFWVLRPFIIVKGNQRGKIEMHAVVSAHNLSHRRAAELTGGSVLDIDGDFSAPLAALGDRIADTVAVALDPVDPGATLAKKSLRVLVDGQPVSADPQNGFVYDERTHSIRFQGAAKQQAFAAKIEITYEEHR
ncbi:MAG: Ig-like domain-containing protein [Opitutae bacterium]|nr:Ig-like domain-containing protein [Opitutae bacterium]